MKFLVRKPELYAEPKVAGAPPLWIRGLLILTSAGVSFAHGSNHGQKGMGLIMLILIGIVPTAYALNRALPESQVAPFVQSSLAASKVVETKAAGYNVLGDPRPAVTNYVTTHQINEGTYPSLAVLVRDIAKQVQFYGITRQIPAASVGKTRNDMYLTSEAIRLRSLVLAWVCLPHAMHLVGWQVVHHNPITGREVGNENLLDISAESIAIHRAVEHKRRREAADPQPSREGRRLPMAVRNRGKTALSFWRPPVEARHLGGGTS